MRYPVRALGAIEKFLRKRPRTSQDLLHEFGNSDTVGMMRQLSDMGTLVLNAQVFTDRGWRTLYWIEQPRGKVHRERVLAANNITSEDGVVL